ncbi:oxidoreductase [Nocardia sp. NBC_00565]|uniref:oxidoreductase n=1 Tax=Nocardia sp. NBC_00565 TaxID=2975993 RepID=UPI002E810456|nr:oxidoreductase [Nocardia sp. NBC_00565]WUC02550.1 oxidoreductase [Nocardia sp. NBC_00565]
MNQIWIVTGANSGFGRAITEAAVAAGNIVVAAARRPETLVDLVAAYPDRVEALRLDVTDQIAIANAVADIAARYGHIDVLVNNAGRSHIGSFEETSDAELRDLFELHVFGPAALVRAVLPHMRAQRSGAIIQVSSLRGQTSRAGFAAYSGGKFAIEGMSEALAREARPLGIKVMIVEPGSFRTSLPGNTTVSPALPDYTGTVGRMRAVIAAGEGEQPGDPARGAALVLTALDADRTPLRLVLGADAVDGILAHLDQVRDDIEAWEDASRETGFRRSRVLQFG